jgi:hypothetical protein
MASRNDLLSPEYIGEVRHHFIFCKGKCEGVGGNLPMDVLVNFVKVSKIVFNRRSPFLLFAHPNFEFFLQPCKEIEE